MTFFHVIILSIVEGITEFLPISSTAHLEFTSHLLGLTQTDFLTSFIIAIQSGAILAVVWLYRKKIFLSWKTFSRIIVGFIPTAIIGFLLYSVIKNVLLGNVWLGAVVLIIGGIIIVISEWCVKKYIQAKEEILSIENLSYREMIILGIIQSLAVVPGVSRSGALIIGGLLMKMPRVVIVEAAFLLAIPTMLAATGYDILKTGISFSREEWSFLAVGIIVSALVAYAVARWLLSYVQRNTFTVFGWYRVIVGVILLLVFFLI